jgi:hypothetical protein
MGDERRPNFMLRLQLLRDIATARDRVIEAAKALRDANQAWLEVSRAASHPARQRWMDADQEFQDAVDALWALEKERDNDGGV